LYKRNWFINFVITFIITFIFSFLVALIRSLVSDGSAVLDWETLFRFAFIFGMVMPLSGRLNLPVFLDT